MGFSIKKVFAPIEEAMQEYCEVDSFYLPSTNYSPLSLLKNIRATVQKCKSKKYDIVHITGVEHYLLPFLRQNNTIVTVHDLGFYTNNKLSIIKSLWKFYIWIYPINFASRVTFISEKSKAEADRLLTLEPNKSQVIWNPVDTTFKYVPKKLNQNKPTVLHLGTKDNKNLRGTIKALAKTSCHLRIVGKLTDDTLSLLNENDIEYSNVYNITDQQILEEYINCDIVSMVSFYEGFGMPIIEGQATGRVVVTSNVSPMKEITNGSAVLVDPYSIESIKSGYRNASENYAHYVELGLRNIERFQKSNIVKKYCNLYKNLIKQ